MDLNKPMTAKDRRIWRRREANRNGHGTRCYISRNSGLGLCTCSEGLSLMRQWGVRNKAQIIRD